ncbi:hypothetical protein San01_25420 [Streptomyces angustmyceticus]|uniref:Uncharacterized protein n=1 Tax=Streptomyces angustmyceticus TaxID=285578 RepID=A0A5J4LIK4_9ACTN|nr:hypothetical protein San01_25420 [Streptomyces angustmyceticus]
MRDRFPCDCRPDGGGGKETVLKILLRSIRDRWKERWSPEITAPRVSACVAVVMLALAVADRVSKLL